VGNPGMADGKIANDKASDRKTRCIGKTDLPHLGNDNLNRKTTDGKAADRNAVNGKTTTEMRAKFLLGPEWESFAAVYNVQNFMPQEPIVNYPGLGYYRNNALERAASIISSELARRNRGWTDEQLQEDPVLELECERLADQIEDICLSSLELGLFRAG
jgi:hypothetical protein